MDAEEIIEPGLPTFFLDTLPKEVLDNVLRFFSRIPKAKNWERHILLQDLVALFRVIGQLGTLMKSRFTALCVSRTGACIPETHSYHWDPPTKGMLSTTDINVARAYILAGGGQALRTLAVGLHMYIEEDGVCIVHDFAANCPNIVSLSVHERGQDWVSRFGKQLKKLQISTNSTQTISRCFSSLYELNLRLRTTEEGDAAFWEHVGDKLEKLSLRCDSNLSVDHIAIIQKNCRNIRHLDIFGPVEWSEEISKLLCSYGEKLESAYIYNLGEKELLNVVNSCKNCRFHLRPSHGRTLLPSLRILGHQLDGVHADYRNLDLKGRDYDEFRKAWDGCFNLRQLLVEDFTVEDMKAIMSTPKTHVEALNLRMWHLEKEAVKEMLDICSRGVTNVKKVAYSGREPAHDAFDMFIEKNKSSFRAISLNTVADTYEYEKLLEVIQPFVGASVSIELCLLGMYGDVRENVLRKVADCGVLVRESYGIPRYAS